MSADLLRKAANCIKDDQEREFLLGHIDNRERLTWFASADWLYRVAADLDEADHNPLEVSSATRIARVYLGDPS